LVSFCNKEIGKQDGSKLTNDISNASIIDSVVHNSKVQTTWGDKRNMQKLTGDNIRRKLQLRRQSVAAKSQGHHRGEMIVITVHVWVHQNPDASAIFYPGDTKSARIPTAPGTLVHDKKRRRKKDVVLIVCRFL
jgi:hypothetical protein